eukprot:366131-Chlamydomonas_euryale.AAC.27
MHAWRIRRSSVYQREHACTGRRHRHADAGMRRLRACNMVQRHNAVCKELLSLLTWRHVACLRVPAQGRFVTLVRWKGELHAIDSICFHAGGPLVGLNTVKIRQPNEAAKAIPPVYSCLHTRQCKSYYCTWLHVRRCCLCLPMRH